MPTGFEDWVRLVVSQFEYAGLNKTIIAEANARTTGGTTIMHTVNAGKNLFITAVWITGQGTSVGAIINCFIRERTNNTILIRITGDDTVAQSNSLTLLQPVKVLAGDDIEFVVAIGQATAQAGFIGWEEDE